MDKEKEFKFIMVFCPVVSRAGTDIEAALRQLKKISGNSDHKTTGKSEVQVNSCISYFM